MPLPEDFHGFPEPQFTPVPNLIFDLLLAEMPLSEMRVLLFIVRRSMGWNSVRKARMFVPASVAQIQDGTGLSRPAVIDAIKSLESQRLIIRRRQRDPGGHVAVTLYRLRFETDQRSEEEDENPELTEFTQEGERKQNQQSLSKLCEDKVYSGEHGHGVSQGYKEILNKNTRDTPLPPTVEKPPTGNFADGDQHTRELTYVPLGGPLRTSKPKPRSRHEPKPSPVTDALRARREAEFGNGAVTAPSPAASVNGNGHHGLPHAAEEWNRVVTSGPPVEEWTRYDQSLREIDNPDLAAALPVVLARCQEAFHDLPADEVDWLHFRWLLGSKAGVPNWYRVKSGKVFFKRKRPGSKPDPLEEIRKELGIA